MVVRDNSFPGAQGPNSFSQLVKSDKCEFEPNFGIVETRFVINKAIDSVNNWIATRTPAAPTLLIQVSPEGKIIRDESGRAEGGVRLSGFEQPTAIFAMNGPGRGCSLSAHHQDFTTSELKARYGTHANYVKQVKATIEQLRRAGYLLKFDGQAAVDAAERSNVAR